MNDFFSCLFFNINDKVDIRDKIIGYFSIITNCGSIISDSLFHFDIFQAQAGMQINILLLLLDYSCRTI